MRVLGNRMGTFSPVRTKHKLYQSPVCVEETSASSSELGGSASLLFSFYFLQNADTLEVEIERLARGKAGLRELRALRVCTCVCARAHARV